MKRGRKQKLNGMELDVVEDYIGENGWRSGTRKHAKRAMNKRERNDAKAYIRSLV